MPVKSEFAGKTFYDKVYKEAHTELLWQHRGKGRWYIVDNVDATVPPPVQALAKAKATQKKKAASSDKTQDEQPKEPRVVRKRRAAKVIDLEGEPGTELEPEGPPRGSKRRRSPAGDAVIATAGDATVAAPAVAPTGALVVNSDDEDPAKPLTPEASPPQKKTCPTPKPIVKRNPHGEMTSYSYVPPRSLPDEPTMQDELKSDMDAMGSSAFPPLHLVDIDARVACRWACLRLVTRKVSPPTLTTELTVMQASPKRPSQTAGLSQRSTR